MVQVRDLTELTVGDLWSEVKDEDEWWGEVKRMSMRGVKRLLESAMEEELLEQLHAGKYRRTELRRGYRNGYRHRGLLTEFGPDRAHPYPSRPRRTLPDPSASSLPAATEESQPDGARDVSIGSEHP